MFPQTLVVTAHVAAVRGGAPAAMFVHAPRLLARAQLWQPPTQSELQHSPVASAARFFTQNPDEQSLATAHTLPVGSFSPHLFVWVLHVIPVLQSVLAVQVVRQVAAATLQAKGSHILVLDAGHAPLPSQLAVLVWTTPVQLWSRQPTVVSQK